jgi:hypothetical protein
MIIPPNRLSVMIYRETPIVFPCFTDSTNALPTIIKVKLACCFFDEQDWSNETLCVLVNHVRRIMVAIHAKYVLTIDTFKYRRKKLFNVSMIYANNKIVPWGDIKGWCPLDEMWHEHILDTHKYARDCNTIFGRMIHHDPNLPAGTTNHTNHWEKTKRVYKEVFKVDL